VRETLAGAADRLRAAGIESARLDSRVLLAQCLGLSPDAVFAADAPSAPQLETFERLIARRAGREPLAYITGRREFWSLSFAVGPGVLIPRPETETLVEAVLAEYPEPLAPLRVLDIGTGSGCLLCALLAERPRASGFGVDSSTLALDFARRNAARHGLDARARLLEASWCPAGERDFDVIFSNPPYLTEEEFELSPPEIRDHEPRIALAAGPDGLAAMRALGLVFARTLGHAGLAFLEIGFGQCDKIDEIMGSCGLELRRAIPDLSEVPRCLVIGRPGKGGA
jgi:release factor glutamine methyltransferase